MNIVFITGGVISSLGKGLATSAMASLIQEYPNMKNLAKENSEIASIIQQHPNLNTLIKEDEDIRNILKKHGYKVMTMKLDPYLNYDSGNMNPEQHGEVFVTEDGLATDLDLGHYERFLRNTIMNKDCSVTAGKIYSELIDKERSGKYLGSTIQVIPHVTDLIKEKIIKNSKKCDFLFCEIGGTIGDIEALPFLEAIRQIRYDIGIKSTLFIHLTLLPFIDSAGELKTKPTQRSVKEMLSLGIQPDILLCRTKNDIPKDIKKKIAQFCNIDEDAVFPAIDVNNIYEIPLVYHKNKLDLKILNYFDINPIKYSDLSQWKKYQYNLKNPKYRKKIAIISKYKNGKESYKSIFEALQHASVAQNVDLQIECINVKEVQEVNKLLKDYDGILIPGGFGHHGTKDKISAIQYARENDKPLLGICFGLQMMAIEFAINVLNINNASSREFHRTEDNEEIEPIIDYTSNIINDHNQDFEKITLSNEMKAQMHIGAEKIKIKKNSKTFAIYQEEIINNERNRHRSSFNNKYEKQFAEKGMIVSSYYQNNKLPAIIELKNKKFFIGTQFHPELISNPRKPHPLFINFIKAIISELVSAN